jgi:hypothetical protein
MSSKRSRSSRSRALKSSTRPITFSSKDSAFEQALIDSGVYPPDYSSVKPGNLEEMIGKLGQPRASLSPSKLSSEEFADFKKKNSEAKTEAEVMSQVFPMITGKANILSGYNQVFNNLEPLAHDISKPQPDYFNGSCPAEIRRKVRDDLEKQIVPSNNRDCPALPNFFMEAKGPGGKPSEVKRQITQDLGVGARGMLRMQSYGLDAPIFDDTAHTFGSTYHDGYIQLYAMHPTEPGDANRRSEYHTTKIRGFDLTDSLDTHRQGITAFRNLRDLAKERRDEFVAHANERADNVDEPGARSVHPRLTSFLSTNQSTKRALHN